MKIYSLLSYTAWTPYLIVLRVEKKKEIRSVQRETEKEREREREGERQRVKETERERETERE